MYVENSQANSTTNITETECPPYEETTTTQICKTLAYAVIITLSLTGNVVVVTAIYRKRRMRTVTNLFIGNLAVSDLLITFLGMPNMITQLYLRDKWIFGAVICKIVVFFQSVSVASSVLTLLAITWDRFWAIVFPLRLRLSKGMAKGLVFMIWVLSCATMAPFLYAQTVVVGPGGYEICIERWEPAFDGLKTAKDYTVVLFVTLYVVPLLVMSALYSVILRKLWMRKVPGTHVNSNELKRRDSKRKIVKMLMTVTLSFAVCWLPLYVYQFIAFFAWEIIPCFDSNYVFYFVSLFFGHANSALNPFLYVLFHKRYRDEFKAAFMCKKHQYHRRRGGSFTHTRSRMNSWIYRSLSLKRLSREEKQLTSTAQRKKSAQETSRISTSKEVKDSIMLQASHTKVKTKVL